MLCTHRIVRRDSSSHCTSHTWGRFAYSDLAIAASFLSIQSLTRLRPRTYERKKFHPRGAADASYQSLCHELHYTTPSLYMTTQPLHMTSSLYMITQLLCTNSSIGQTKPSQFGGGRWPKLTYLQQGSCSGLCLPGCTTASPWRLRRSEPIADTIIISACIWSISRSDQSDLSYAPIFCR